MAVTIKQIRTFAQKNHGDFHSHSFSKVINAINALTKSEGTRIYEQAATIFSNHSGYDPVLFKSMDKILLQAVEGELANGEYKYLPIKATYLGLIKNKHPVYRPRLGSGENCLSLEFILHIVTTHRWAVLLDKLQLIHHIPDLENRMKLLKLGKPDSKVISHESLEKHDQNTLNYKYLTSGDNVGKGGKYDECIRHKCICNGKTGDN
jgi:hypothetical protein